MTREQILQEAHAKGFARALEKVASDDAWQDYAALAALPAVGAGVGLTAAGAHRLIQTALRKQMTEEERKNVWKQHLLAGTGVGTGIALSSLVRHLRS